MSGPAPLGTINRPTRNHLYPPHPTATRDEVDAWLVAQRSFASGKRTTHEPKAWCPFCDGLSPQWMRRLPTGKDREWCWWILRVHRRSLALRDDAKGLRHHEAPRVWTDHDGREWYTSFARSGTPTGPAWDAVRAFVFRRDGDRCLWCNSTGSLVLDHIVSRAVGGSHHPDNLRVLCVECNSTKGGLVDVPLIYGQPRRRSA